MRATVRVYFLLFPLLMLAADLGLAAEDTWGRWQDDGAANIYEFRPDHQFRFIGYKKVWVQRQGFAPNPFSNLPRSREPQGQYMRERKEMSGAWETRAKVCSVTVPGKGEVSGNLKLYVDYVECCMEAKRLGPTLVLSVLQKNDTPSGDKNEPEVCVNRALHQSTEEAK